MFEELDIIELVHDIDSHDLKKGERGTVVGIYKEGAAYEVEFITTVEGASIVLTLEPLDMRPIREKHRVYEERTNGRFIYDYIDLTVGGQNTTKVRHIGDMNLATMKKVGSLTNNSREQIFYFHSPL